MVEWNVVVFWSAVIIAVLELLLIVFGNLMLNSIPLVLFKAKLRNKLVADIENKDKSIEYATPEIKEGYLQLQDYGIGSVLVTPDKIRHTKGGLRIIRVSSDLPEGYTAEDVKMGYTSSPQMIDRFNERIADKLAEERADNSPESKITKAAIILALILGVAIAGYMLIGKLSEWNTASQCMTMLNQCRNPGAALVSQAVSQGLNQTGIY